MGCLFSKRGSSPPRSTPRRRTSHCQYPRKIPVTLYGPLQLDEQQVQKLVAMGFAEAAVRSALRTVNGNEILAIKKLRSAKGAPAGNNTNAKLNEQQVQKLVAMGFAEAAVRSALRTVNGNEILAIKKLRSAEGAPAGNNTNAKNKQRMPSLSSKGTRSHNARSKGGASRGHQG